MLNLAHVFCDYNWAIILIFAVYGNESAFDLTLGCKLGSFYHLYAYDLRILTRTNF